MRRGRGPDPVPTRETVTNGDNSAGGSDAKSGTTIRTAQPRSAIAPASRSSVFTPPDRLKPASGIVTLSDAALPKRLHNRAIAGQRAELYARERDAERLFERHDAIKMPDRIPVGGLLGRQPLVDLVLRHLQHDRQDVLDALVHLAHALAVDGDGFEVARKIDHRIFDRAMKDAASIRGKSMIGKELRDARIAIGRYELADDLSAPPPQA